MKGTVKAKAFWLRYCLALAQVLVIVAYFLPWERIYASISYAGPLELLYPSLMDGPSSGLTFYTAIALFICFTAAIISLLLSMFAIAKKREHTVALRASSMLNSLALAGPLLYVHWELPWPIGSADLSVLWSALDEMVIGWFIALFSGSAACLLTLGMYHEACKSNDGNRNSIRLSPAKSHTASLFWVSIPIIVFGCAITVAGFFLAWNSGSASSLYGQSPYSNNGSEVSPLVYLVLVIAVLSTALVILCLFVRKMSGLVILQFAQDLLIVTLALTLFWGLVFGEYRTMTVGAVFAAKLQLGWYLCVIGQLIMLTSVILFHYFQYGAPGDRKIWRLKSNSE